MAARPGPDRAGPGGADPDRRPDPPPDLDRLACDSTLTRIVLDGAGQVLDVGRSQRSVPWHLWIALITRHPGCWIQDCTEPVQRTEAHHAQPFSQLARSFELDVKPETSQS